MNENLCYDSKTWKLKLIAEVILTKNMCFIGGFAIIQVKIKSAVSQLNHFFHF